MANKYLSWGTTAIQEVEAKAASAGAGDAGKIVALDTAGLIDETMMPLGVSAETQVAEASGALAENDVVNFFDDTGTLKCRKADATDATKPTHGYVKAAVLDAGNATVFTDGFLPGTGLTKGSKYFLSAATAGLVATTAPSTTGNIAQAVGFAVSATLIKFEPVSDFIIRA